MKVLHDWSCEIVSNFRAPRNTYVNLWRLPFPEVALQNGIGVCRDAPSYKIPCSSRNCKIPLELLTDNLPIIAIFLVAGMVKGVVGMGLPTLSLALLTLIADLTSAMALMLVPALVTNVYQAFSGGRVVEVFKTCPLFFVMAGLAIWLGVPALVRVDLPLLSGLLGVCLVIYSVVSMAGIRLMGSWPQHWWTGPVFGAANGVLTGLTGSFVFPGLIYLQSIGLSRNELVQAMGILFGISTIFLAWSMGQLSLLTAALAIQSSLAVIPAIIGMIAGSSIRNRIPRILFRRLFFIVLALIGTVHVFNSVINMG